MPDVDVVAVLIATVAAFLLGGGYYAALGDQLAAASGPDASTGSTAPWMVGVELGRCLVLSAVVAGLAAQGDIDGLAGGLALGLALWIGFPLVLWIGAIVHEGTRVRLAAIHAGDWLIKLLAISAIVSLLA